MPRANRHFLPGYVWQLFIYVAARSIRSITRFRSSCSNRART
jgi:hypothetical protein